MAIVRYLGPACIGLALAAFGCSKQSGDDALTIATAASLAGAFDALGDAYTEKTGKKVSLVIASSGKLTQQIKQGAPYDIFASANVMYTEQLIDAKEADRSTLSVYANGRLAMWVKHGNAPTSLSELTDSTYEHVAIANPKHAPYGVAAKEALESQKLWAALKGKLVRGSNVRQAMQFAESGNAEVAIIAHSLALHGGGDFTLIDEHLHTPLQQSIVVLTRTKKKNDAIEFIEFINSDAGRTLLKPFGLQVSAQ